MVFFPFSEKLQTAKVDSFFIEKLHFLPKPLVGNLSSQKEHQLADRQCLLIAVYILNEINQLNDSIKAWDLLELSLYLAVVACLTTLFLRKLLS